MKNVLLIIVKGIIPVHILYIWLLGMLAVVKSATDGTIMEPILDIRCSLYPKIHSFVWLNPHLASVSIPEHGNTPSSIEDLCQT